MAVTTAFQSFEGGAVGADLTWESTEPLGAPLWLSGTGTAKFTDAAVHGTRAATVANAVGQGWVSVVHALPAGSVELRWSAYFRMPATVPIRWGIAHISCETVDWTYYLNADGSVAVSPGGGSDVVLAPAGSIAAGSVFRLTYSGGIDPGGAGAQYGTAAFLGEAGTEPLGESLAVVPIAGTGVFANVQVGILGTADSSIVTPTTFDSFRVESGTARGDLPATYLPPEGAGAGPAKPPQRSWVREPVGWRRLGALDAVDERYVPPTGRGAAAPGQQSYTVPAGALHVAPGGNDSTGTGAAGAPYATIAKAITAAAPGGTIVLRAGNHRLGYKPASAATYSPTDAWAGILADKANLTIMGYPGEAAWIDGSAVHTGWTKVGSVWEKPLVLTHDRSPTGGYGADDNTAPGWQYVNPARPLAAWPERVWIDGRELTQVTSRAAVTAGTFAVEGATGGTGSKLFTSSKYVIGDDPTAKEVRVAEYTTCLSSTGTGFTLKGVGVRRYATSVAQRGAVKLRHADCRVENVTIEDCSAVAVTLFEAHRAVLADVTVRRVGLLGIEGTESDDLTLERLLVARCNTQGFNHAPEAGGIKLTHMRRPTVRNATIHDVAATGLWLDESVSLAVVHTCDVHWCDNHGIHVELGGAATVANCVISAPGNDCVQVFNASGAVRLWNNTLTRPGRLAVTGRCVSIVADDRAPLKSGSVGLDPRYGFPHPDGVDALTVDVTIKNNVLGPSLAQGFVWNEDWSTTKRAYTAFGIKSASNVHVLRRGKPDWKWTLSNAGTADPTILWSLSEMQSRGLETGSVTLLDDYAADVGGRLTSRAVAARPAGQALPADVASILGVAAGGTNLVGAVR